LNNPLWLSGGNRSALASAPLYVEAIKGAGYTHGIPGWQAGFQNNAAVRTLFVVVPDAQTLDHEIHLPE